jgi:hypothetical protein
MDLNVSLTLRYVHHSNGDTSNKITNKVMTPLVVREPLNYWNQVLQKVDKLPFSVIVPNSIQNCVEQMCK